MKTLPGTAVDPFEGASEAVPPTHIEISSAGLGGSSKRYFSLRFADKKTINPNILPHPTLADTFIVVTQEHPSPPGTAKGHVSELMCNAAFRDGVLSCVSFPMALAITASPTKTSSDRCNDERDKRYAALALSAGPHDARVFYGPKGVPYVVYGANSGYTCFGQFVQDFRVPARYEGENEPFAAGVGPKKTSISSLATPTPPSTGFAELFRNGTEMRRPGEGLDVETSGAKLVEKNWFVFWDREGAMYAHQDMHPRRSFARLGPDGGALGPNLAPDTADADVACMARHIPRLSTDGPAPSTSPPDRIHQATNSLAVTLCRRADPACEALPGNTFVMVVVHRKRSRGPDGSQHSYEPHAVLFRQAAPFALHGVSTRPLWIRGRRSLAALPDSPLGFPVVPDGEDDGRGRNEMFYVTSIGWAGAGGRYHGFLDDVIFLGFGVEDRRSAGIDVVAGDLLKGLGLCGEARP